jgi:hypothetical protein
MLYDTRCNNTGYGPKVFLDAAINNYRIEPDPDRVLNGEVPGVKTSLATMLSSNEL